MTGFGMWVMFSLWMFSGNHYIVGSIALAVGSLQGYMEGKR
jgi:hypothetical protein